MGSDTPTAEMLRGGNGELFSTLDTSAVVIATPTAFAGATTDARGDDAGANDPYTLFTVTGMVLVRVFGEVTVDLTGDTATVSLGVTGNIAAFIAVTTATDLDNGDLFTATTPPVGTDLLADISGPHIVGAGASIVEAVESANVTAGNIKYYCLWRPLEAGASVISAV